MGNEAHQISPPLIRENFRLGFFDCGIYGGRVPAVDFVEIFRDGLWIGRAYVRGQRLGIKVAAGFLELFGQTLGALNRGAGMETATFNVGWITTEFTRQGEWF